MRETGMRRVRRVLAAVKQAEMVQLAALRQAAAAEREQAARLRARASTVPAAETASDMLATCAWQRLSEDKAKDAERRAQAIDAQSHPHEIAVARAIGRETVVDGVIQRMVIEGQKKTERRAESVPSGASSKLF